MAPGAHHPNHYFKIKGARGNIRALIFLESNKIETSLGNRQNMNILYRRK